MLVIVMGLDNFASGALYAASEVSILILDGRKAILDDRFRRTQNMKPFIPSIFNASRASAYQLSNMEESEG
jgi:hypothetical protein